jgi:putative tricarboxylic transport membrane protein
MKRRQILKAGLACVTAGITGARAASSWKPTRFCELVIPASAGGVSDVMARFVKKFAEENKLIDVPLNVVNKTGANGAIAISYVNQFEGRGEVLLASVHTNLTQKLTGESKLDYRDTTPVALLFKESHVIVVKADSPIREIGDLVTRMRADPASLSFGHFGNRGNHPHIAAIIPLKAAGVDTRQMRTVSYRSGPEAVAAVAGGSLDIALVSAAVPRSFVESGKVRVISQTSAVRLPGYLASVPTWKEAGVDVEYATAQGFLGPRGMAPEQVAYWENIFARLAENEEWRRFLVTNFWVSAYMPGTQMKKYYDDEFAKFKPILEELGVAK